MTTQAQFTLRGRNPDILSCIASLSNDEVFTPPEFANRMLDTIAEAWAADHNGASIWEDSSVTFLDPCTKSGVFLREITRRLTDGLAKQIPDLQTRVDHILTKQVFGIGITRLTSLMARRSLYCTKHANGAHSIAKSFTNDAGNIWYERMEHTWKGSKCVYCGAPKTILEREGAIENYAYAFIHTDNIQSRLAEMFGANMQFDVIIGNPPYQMDDGGFGTSAVPIYHLFTEQARSLAPRYLCFVIPARWYTGGKGLDDFRTGMLTDERIRIIHDYPDSNDVFPGTQIKGGICYLLWDRDNPGKATVTTHWGVSRESSMTRDLLEDGADVFIRYNEAVSILKKVMAKENGDHHELRDQRVELPEEKQFMQLVSSSKPFGLRTYYKGSTTRKSEMIKVYQNGGVGYVLATEVEKNVHVIDRWKVFIPRAGSGSDSFPHPILGRPFVGAPGTASTETYNFIGPFANENETLNAISYIATRFFRFLVLLHKSSQDANRAVYKFVPLQNFSRSWNDQQLFEKYGLDDSEISFIHEMVRPMIVEAESNE
jgi:hypothetical protein